MRRMFVEIYNGLLYRSGEFSSTKFWSSIAYATATWIMCYLTTHGLMNAEYFLFYLGIVAGHATASKFLARKIEIEGEKNNVDGS